MKRILVDLQTLQSDGIDQVVRDPLVRMIQSLGQQCRKYNVDLHLIGNGADEQMRHSIARLFPEVFTKGFLHWFYGLGGIDSGPQIDHWRREVSKKIWQKTVEDIAPSLLILPDVLVANKKNVSFSPCNFPTLGLVRQSVNVTAGPSKFRTDKEHLSFLKERYALLTPSEGAVATHREIADELRNYPIKRFPHHIEVVYSLADLEDGSRAFAQVCIDRLRKIDLGERDEPQYWEGHIARLAEHEEKLISEIQNVSTPKGGVPDIDLAAAAKAVSSTLSDRLRAYRDAYPITEPVRWWLEGPFDSSYSLAVVNRETARAFTRAGMEVVLKSSEGGGDFDPDPSFLEANADICALHEASKELSPERCDVTSRNMFPPRAEDVRSPYNLLHGYAWEETGFPDDFAKGINQNLQGLLVTSEHVKRVLTGAGVLPPVYVVGNGVDHLDVEKVPLSIEMPDAGFKILHVSSCFPRKGVDVLLRSYARAFTEAHDVCLIIKTHENPHNFVEDMVRDLRLKWPNMAPVHLIFEDLPEGEMRSLYEAADLLVAPSRAEGFCLPVAEAVLAGVPVLTTGWGGQTIFADNPLVQFIDYQFAAAESHLDTWLSAWVDPDEDHLTQLLQECFKAPALGPDDKQHAMQHMLEKHSWENVTSRSRTALNDLATNSRVPPPKIGWVSTYNTRCGIATYSEHLIQNIRDRVQIFATKSSNLVRADDERITRCWEEGWHDDLRALYFSIVDSKVDIVVLQFNYGFFDIRRLAWLVNRLLSADIKVVMQLHSTDDAPLPDGRKLFDIKETLRRIDLLLVHGINDLNRLKKMGVIDNVSLFPHGVPTPKTRYDRPALTDRPIIIGTYGFFLPQKNLIALVEALSILRAQGHNILLKMVNAAYPVPESQAYIDEVMTRIEALDLGESVEVCTEFLTDEESFEKLALCDLMVFPYGPTSESASGAVRQALALDCPVAVTPLAIFDDVRDLVHFLPGFEVADLVSGLEQLIADLKRSDPEGKLAHVAERVNSWRSVHGYDALGDRLWRILHSVHRESQSQLPSGLYPLGTMPRLPQ